MQPADISIIQGILRQLCPRCRSGKIFRGSVWGFPKMHEQCPACGLKFEREQGYFLGAMYFSYTMGIGLIVLLSALLWEVFRWSLMRSMIAGMLLFLPLVPLVTWMARVLWIYMDQAVDPDRT
jgi:uncharacterized protein (DUF983 family)